MSSATFKSINETLEYIKKKVGFLLNTTELKDNIKLLKEENSKLRLHLKEGQSIPPETPIPNLSTYKPIQGQPPLDAINKICDYAFNRNKALLEYKDKLSQEYNLLKKMVPNLSIKEYIMECVDALAPASPPPNTYQSCYDKVDEKIRDIIKFDFDIKQLFRYKLYDLIYDNDENTFRSLLVSDKKYTYPETKELVQRGGKDVRLLQIITISTINKILSFLNKENSVKDTAQLLEKYETNIERTTTGKLTAEECLQIYKNGEIINTIVSFFYTESIIPLQPQP